MFLHGTWDSTAVLLDAGDAIDATARRLPYLHGYRASLVDAGRR
jgi:hypothetical protein